MKNSINQFDSTNSITLVHGDAAEIAQALKTLGADESIIAKATVSFLVKIPGAIVSRVEGGFQVGNSYLPESQATTKVVGITQGKFAQLIAIGAASDVSYAQAA